MTSRLVLLFAFSLLVSQSLVSAQSYPASGVYLYLGESILTVLSQDFTASVMNAINAYTDTPPYSGSGSGVDFTFSSFQYDIYLGDMSWGYGYEPSSAQIDWTPFTFTITFNYHICSTDWPHPCEDGWVKIYTTDNNVILESVIVFDYTGATVYLNDSFAGLAFQQGDINIYVQCTNSICVISPSDIANAIAQNFVATFQRSVEKVVNDVIRDKFNDIELFRPINLKDGTLDIDLDGEFYIVQTFDSTPPVIFTSSGAVVENSDGDIIFPPFEPSIVPDTVLENSTYEANIYFTPYVIDCAFWSMGTLGELNAELTPNEVPKSSPVQLNTNDPFFSSVVPGLSKYPNMNITVDVTYLQTLPAYIDNEGIHPGGNFSLAFSLTSDTKPDLQNAWVLGVGIILDLELKASLIDQNFTFSFLLKNETSSVTVISSQVGDVITEGFVQLFQLLIQAVPPVIKGMSLFFPDFVSPSGFDIIYGDGYVGIGVNVV
eukprot:TRINITY_DN2915_c0_g2_i1.p1 TRINITY_DN2915_c0_g2~~TRINITY_DN2915_c0_g2_i1.p1  ORF type:complete len:543 (-),score=117.49 TRINITY_DN2915_c0_g2_i1:148-1614(-)